MTFIVTFVWYTNLTHHQLVDVKANIFVIIIIYSNYLHVRLIIFNSKIQSPPTIVSHKNFIDKIHNVHSHFSALFLELTPLRRWSGGMWSCFNRTSYPGWTWLTPHSAHSTKKPKQLNKWPKEWYHQVGFAVATAT